MSDQTERNLDRLFADYRNACPDFEGSASFTPELWQKIDASRGFTIRLRRMSRLVLSASAALSLAMGIVLLAPRTPAPVSSTYLEILDDDQLHEMAYADVMTASDGPGDWK